MKQLYTGSRGIKFVVETSKTLFKITSCKIPGIYSGYFDHAVIASHFRYATSPYFTRFVTGSHDGLICPACECRRERPVPFPTRSQAR